MRKNKTYSGFDGLTARSILLTILGSVLITVSSLYIALKMSALPWPTIFVAVLSMSLLKFGGRITKRATSIHEINITQTGMSGGAMVAGGIAFTVPALFISGVYEPYDAATMDLSAWMLPKFWPIFFVSLAGVIIGTVLCWIYRRRNVEDLELAYPIGAAAADTLEAGDEGGFKAFLLIISLAFSGLFAVVRDVWGWVQTIYSSFIAFFPVSIYMSPLAIATGYIIGFASACYWFVGALVGLIMQQAGAADVIITAAVGLMVGAGVGIMINFFRTSLAESKKRQRAQKSGKPVFQKNRSGLLLLIASAGTFVITIVAGLSPLVSILAMVGVIFATAMSSVITGQTGINPMEVFGIIILLAIRLFVPVSHEHAIYIACLVAVACGYAGDAMNDYKTGHMLDTSPKSQFVTQLIGGLAGVLVGVPAFFLVIAQYGGVGVEAGLPAAQSHSVAAMVSGIGDPLIFTAALLAGMILYLLKIPSMIIGIGMILGLGMSTSIFIGGLIALVMSGFKSKKLDNSGSIIAAGLLGGEGITSTIIAIIAMIRG
ncbi:MAG TPA: peptide transporter [Clostridiaceae bacterium]|nr:peptide transporter [Clostridiaceae bacterium]